MFDPHEALQALLRPGGLKMTLFPPTSRYYGLETTVMETADGKKIIYLRRRFVSAPERLALIQEHVVVEHDRLDNLAAHYLGDPEQFWRICDANRAMRPEELTAEIGRRLRISAPEGLPGIPNA